ncbi:MAG: adenylate/guanylate cyclase domain-containing protein [Desulfobacterales bacterium]
MNPHLRRKKYGLILLIVSIAFILTLAAERNSLLRPLENIYYDLWHQLAGKRFSPRHVVIAALDDRTLLAHPDEPLAFWGPHFATAIKVLREAGVSAIGIDFLFSVSAESWLKRIQTAESTLSRTFDIPLREQIGSGGVILVGTLVKNQENKTEILLPITDYLFSLPGVHQDIGLSNLYSDEDEVVRFFIPRILKEEHLPGVTFAPLLAERAAGNLLKKTGLSLDDALPRPIGFIGPPGTFPRISLEDLLGPDAASNPELRELRGKIVIIAQENSGTHDIHLTPYARKFLWHGARLMSGPEIHANIIETICTGRFPRPLPEWMNFLWLGLVLGAGTVIFFRENPVRGLAYALILNLACAGISWIFFMENRILRLAGVNVALLLSYIGAMGLRLTREEKMRSHLQRVIGPYVSDAVVNRIVDSGKLPDLGGETLNVTVLFSDIRNFTTISEQLTPREVVEMLNNYYTRICEPILAHSGMIDKYIGDAVMALFGAPVPQPDHARQAVRAAVKMVGIAQEFREWMHSRFPGKPLPRFHIGIGIHSGEAVIGNIGSARRMGYTAIGDTVNIASRLESLSKELGSAIVASAETVRQAGADVKCGQCHCVQVKGRFGQIRVAEILDMEEQQENNGNQSLEKKEDSNG